MPLGEGAASLGEFLVVRRFLGERDAREHLLEIRGKAAAVFRGVQDVVDVVEKIQISFVMEILTHPRQITANQKLFHFRMVSIFH